ncbi:kinetochore-associated protein DSN1 homolog [Clupea harengus]|uniref:Kinetochore-associated protein DSN1 homolog n=1 Tax=Clupea harengus TaxID=7950 RepID=A0A6P3W3T8_CLUHA|nr:kinetochore-associated protein DSN1 homolog [Clupea harengus]
MAEQQQEKSSYTSSRNESHGHHQNEMESEETSTGIKRILHDKPNSEPPHKSSRSGSPSKELLAPGLDDDLEEPKVSLAEEMVPKPTEGSELSPRSRRKSWRRSTRGRQSMPLFSGAVQNLHKSISLSLPKEERIEKLMEGAMNVAVERLQKTLVTLPGADLEMFQTQVESLKKEWSRVANEIRDERKLEEEKEKNTKRDPNIERALELSRSAIRRLETESALWDSLLEKHQSKAEELAKLIEKGERLPLDPSCMAHSSQSELIHSKPNYRNILSRQQQRLYTVELVLDAQCKLFKELLSFQEQCELLVKEISTKLADEAGLQDLPCPVRSLLIGPVAGTSS